MTETGKEKAVDEQEIDYNDDNEVAYICDDCGEEFPSQSSLDGHEAEGCWASRD